MYRRYRIDANKKKVKQKRVFFSQIKPMETYEKWHMQYALRNTHFSKTIETNQLILDWIFNKNITVSTIFMSSA